MFSQKASLLNWWLTKTRGTRYTIYIGTRKLKFELRIKCMILFHIRYWITFTSMSWFSSLYMCAIFYPHVTCINISPISALHQISSSPIPNPIIATLIHVRSNSAVILAIFLLPVELPSRGHRECHYTGVKTNLL